MQGLACVAVIILMLFSSTAWACAESDICIVQSHTASITCSCISLFYVLIWCFLVKSFLSVTEIITGHRCMVKLEDLTVLKRSPDLLNNVKIGQLFR